MWVCVIKCVCLCGRVHTKSEVGSVERSNKIIKKEN